MRLDFICTLIICGVTTSFAQTNPKSGYIITQERDTINGILDYRTDARNARSCLFMAEGDSLYKEYRPTQIYGYGLYDNGAYYETKKFPVDGVQRTFFAELLLKGGINLYHHRENMTEYFYLKDQRGNVATIKESGDIIHRREDQIVAQRLKIQEASQMFQKSQKILRELWSMPHITVEKLVKLTEAYNREFYSDQPLQKYRHEDKMTRNSITARLRVEAGVGINNMTFWPYAEHNAPLEITTFSPIIGIGTDIVIPRFSKNILLQVMIHYNYNKATIAPGKFEKNFEREWSFHDVSLQAGAAYKFLPEKKISPLIRAGVSLDYLFGLKTERMEGYYSAKNLSEDKSFSPRYYIGIGADMKIGKHIISLTGNYQMRNFGTFGLQAPMITIIGGLLL